MRVCFISMLWSRFTSSGVDDLNARRGPLSQDGVFGVFQGDSEGLVVFLQAVVYQEDVPGFHTDSWTETGWRKISIINIHLQRYQQLLFE